MVTEPISDAGLLERFATHRDEAAFGELVKRHGPQVLRVCRRGLPSEHDVEDVFQATFFVLAHKAATVSWTDSVESWLCAVASRLVLHARASAWQRQSRERSVTTLRGTRAQDHGLLPDQYHPLYDPHEELERRDIRRVLDAALGQLPEKYRAPVVLCYLEGKTNEEAARQLGWPTGTMSRRLQRARSLLRQSLARCGLMIALAVCAAFASGRSGQPGPRLSQRRFRWFRPCSRYAIPGGPINARIAASAILCQRLRFPAREQTEALARNARRAAEQTAGQTPGGTPKSGFSRRRKCGWRPWTWVGRQPPAIVLPCWGPHDNWMPPASAVMRSSATRYDWRIPPASACLPARACLELERFPKVPLLQDVWATIGASASGSLLLSWIE